MKAENDCLVGFCHNGSVAACFMNSLLGAFAYDAQRPVRRLVEYHDAAGPYIHDNRARIARYFLDHTSYEWLWMLDNDMEFPPDALHQLLAAADEYDIKILGAAYWNQYRATQCYLSWLAFTPDGIRALPQLPDSPMPLQVTAVGMGCTLIHRDVLQDVADMHPNDPWDTFAADILLRLADGGYLAGDSTAQLQEAAGDREVVSYERMGEDVSMCLRARQCGYLTYGLPTLTAEHFKAHQMAHGSPPVRELVS